uniref:Uncharacterized protein n=1 Tax=Micrurus lemniscatus lemniscatus TaxID=129467 RepID=A0A2D4IN10_MICLE
MTLKVYLAGLLHVPEAAALPCPPGVWIAFGSVTEDLRATGHQVGVSRRSGQDRSARPSLGEGNGNRFANCPALFPGPKPRGSPQPLRKGPPLPAGSKPHFSGLPGVAGALPHSLQAEGLGAAVPCPSRLPSPG